MRQRLRAGGAAAGGLVLAWAALAGGCAAWVWDDQREAKAQAHVQQAQGYLQRGLTDAAMSAFGQALEDNPRVLAAHLGMGQIYQGYGNLEMAARCYERAVRLAPASFEANYYLARTKQLMGKLGEAAQAYLTAVAADPYSFDANHHLAQTYLALKQPQSALPYAREAASLKDDDGPAWVQLGIINSKLDKTAEAAAAFQRAVDRGEVNEPVCLALAEAYIKLGKLKQAEEAVQALLQQKPCVTGFERLGYLLFKQRRYEDALACYRQALKIDGNDTASLNGVGACLMTLYRQAEKPDPAMRTEALEAWRKSVQLRPEQTRIIDLISRYER